MINKVIAGIVGVGACTGIVSIVIAPSTYPATVAAFGGLAGGASIVNEIRKKKEEQEVEAVRVATTFNQLYETNKGLLSPQQLSLLCDVPVERTNAFLAALCQQQGGKHLQTDRGEIYNFPHPANVLEQLTNNAQAWARSQTEPLMQENAALRAELAAAQTRLRAPLPQMPQIPQQPLNNPEEQKDPWNQLL